MTQTTGTVTPSTTDTQRAPVPFPGGGAGVGALVALDIDGTLSAGGTTVPAVTVEAVQDVRRAGHHVVLASGRSLVGVLPVARRLGIDQGWVVASNGAVVARVGDTLPGGYRLEKMYAFDVEPVIRLARAALPAVQVGVEEVGWGYRVDRLFDRRLVNGEQRRVPDTELWNVPAPRVILRAEGIIDLMVPLRALGVTPTPAGPDWVDVTPSGVSKATGLERIRERIGVDPRRTLAVGDGVNDLEMIAWAARGVAMGHAPAAVVDAADEVTGTLEEHGVVTVLRTLTAQDRSPR
ncbi:HAD family hydrolase [Promicromonospora iranensis]|uniref:Hydroxymethylpyrimidine pyrophosphatase-like HAD family hydrolase n=1 Tax=Promicromonospora iranensis TaxID=1105144 RepID=A0ABU2CIM3_9MICO|nr:HAD family hydrolase [Promicromonospora iranensis]MDR7381062.1 hydroxymethylpyrimidine pyrophosphatase-like HAD family hydrolase [Promicromonospora iranensis]